MFMTGIIMTKTIKKSRFDFGAIEAEIVEVRTLTEKLTKLPLSYNYQHLSDSSIIAYLTSKLSLVGVCGLIFALDHVPQNFPNRLETISKILRAILREHNGTSSLTTLSIDDLKICIQLLSKCSTLPNMQINFDDVMSHLSEGENFGYMKFLCPPVTKCITCNQNLRSTTKPTRVTFFTSTRPLPGCKITLKCDHCNLNYNPTMFGNKTDGFQFYQNTYKVDVVEISDESYAEGTLHEWMACLA